MSAIDNLKKALAIRQKQQPKQLMKAESDMSVPDWLQEAEPVDDAIEEVVDQFVEVNPRDICEACCQVTQPDEVVRALYQGCKHASEARVRPFDERGRSKLRPRATVAVRTEDLEHLLSKAGKLAIKGGGSGGKANPATPAT